MENSTIKLPLKRVELSLTKFNEVAVPHHLDLLRQHKANILKYEECGNYSRVRAEQTHARRVAAQLRVLMSEMEALRRQVQPEDWPEFDALTQKSRDLTLRAIMDYLETTPLSVNRRPEERSAAAAAGGAAPAPRGAQPQSEPPLDVQLQVYDHEVGIREREAVLRGWSELQAEVRALHDAWQHVQAAALAQRDQVSVTGSRVLAAAEDVAVARAHLSAAERLKAGALCAGGAALGALVGGPVGLAVGAKAGAAAALAGSLLGLLAGRAAGRRAALVQPADGAPADDKKHT